MSRDLVPDVHPPRVVSNDPRASELKQFGIAIRGGEHHGSIHVAVGPVCRTCGGGLGSIQRVAAAIGVGAGSLSSWLNRRPVRPDIAEKIRAAFAGVSE